MSCEKCFMLNIFGGCTMSLSSEWRTHVMLLSPVEALPLLKFVDNVESG